MKEGITHLLLQKFVPSLQNFEEALEIRRSSLGPMHPFIAMVHNNIGCVYVESHQLKDASNAFESALEVQRTALVNEPENRVLTLSVATTLSNLASLLACMGMLDNCGILLREAILVSCFYLNCLEQEELNLTPWKHFHVSFLFSTQLQESVLRPHHSTVLCTVDALANVCIRNKNFAGALRWFNSLLNRLNEFRPYHTHKIGRNVQRQVIVLYKMSRVHLMQNDKESALQRIKCALQLLQRMDVVGSKGVEGNTNGQQKYLEDLIIQEGAKLEKEIETGSDALIWI